MAISRYEQIARVMRDNKDKFLSATEIYHLVVARNMKKNGLRGPSSIWQILRRYDTMDKIKNSNNLTLYRIKE